MIYSTAESLCGEFFAEFCDLPPHVEEFMGNGMLNSPQRMLQTLLHLILNVLTKSLMNVSQRVVDMVAAAISRNNKGRLRYVVEKLSSGTLSSPGSGQSLSVKRYVEIYEREGGVSKMPRCPRSTTNPSKTKKKKFTQPLRKVKNNKSRRSKKRASSSASDSCTDCLGNDNGSISSELSECASGSAAKRPRFSSVPYSDSASSDGSTTCASGASDDSIILEARPTASVAVHIVALDAESWAQNANHFNSMHFDQDRGVLQSSEDPMFQDVLQDLCHLY
eukprot:gene11677-13564_t